MMLEVDERNPSACVFFLKVPILKILEGTSTSTLKYSIGFIQKWVGNNTDYKSTYKVTF